MTSRQTKHAASKRVSLQNTSPPMNQITKFDAQHEDLIHDVSYDFYGKRLATCSSDQRLKVWDFNDETGIWELNDDWKVILF